MDLFLIDAISLNTDLVSEYPQVVKLGDHLFDEVSGAAKITNKGDSKVTTYKNKEALKLILINPYKGYQRGRAVRYSRDKGDYSDADGRYYQIWFKYDRIIPIIDALKTLGYADYKDGLHYKDEDVYYQSRIWATPKLLDLFHEFEIKQITRLKKRPPKEIIQLRARKKDGGRRLPYKEEPITETMRANLTRYIRFIDAHDVEVRLPPDAEVSWQFLESRRGNILSDRVEITAFETDNAFMLMVGSKKYNGYHIEGMKFIFDHEDMSDDERARLSEWQLSVSNLNSYFQHYIHYTLSRPLSQYSPLSPTSPPTPLSMTQSFCQIAKADQALPLPKPTTIRDLEEFSRKRHLSHFGIRRLDFRSKWQHLHRVFTQYLDQGGRFYGAVHLDLPSEFRAHIFIDGQPTVEQDYGAHHVRMLYNWMEIPYDKDPYQELCRSPEERPIYKKVLLVGINAKTEESGIRAISKELREDGFQGECLTHKYLKDCLDRFKEFHKPIAGFIHKGAGLFLQYDDSRIMDEILMSMVSRKIPVLPVHDSVIAPAEHEMTLRQVMTEAYQKIMGKGFLPVIK